MVKWHVHCFVNNANQIEMLLEDQILNEHP